MVLGVPIFKHIMIMIEVLPLPVSLFQISIFVSKVSEGFDKLCDADPATLMTVPPSSNFSFSQFMRDLCDIDFTALEAESNEYYGGQIIIDAVNIYLYIYFFAQLCESTYRELLLPP